LLIVVLSLAAVGSASAAEIRLLNDATPSGPVVRLGDIAEIYAADPERAAVLRSVELFAVGRGARVVPARDVQELLFLRGFNPAECRLSGASHVTLAPAPQPKEQKTVMPAMEKRAADMVRAAIQQYTIRQRHAKEVVELDFTLSDAQVRALDGVVYRFAIRGGAEPWLGSQRYEILLEGGGKPLQLDATVRLPPSAVVAKRAIDRGEILQAEDVALERLKPGTDTSGLFDRVDAVVGHETTRAIGPGQSIDDGSLRHPLLVRKGDAVTVYTRSPGLQVRTTARSRDDGSLGELITIESMLNRQTFLARVSGSQEAEIYARPADTGIQRASGGDSSVARGGQ
ncbi:MAG TPA: flagellar basal body P-ring formation chaperone FlgA, partial [Pirellulales bacterium]|nr:flagellar basal body P-ring formation chaperone FlgA [Pirellulales bacterium]